jgi:hypothetical protein
MDGSKQWQRGALSAGVAVLAGLLIVTSSRMTMLLSRFDNNALSLLAVQHAAQTSSLVATLVAQWQSVLLLGECDTTACDEHEWLQMTRFVWVVGWVWEIVACGRVVGGKGGRWLGGCGRAWRLGGWWVGRKVGGRVGVG